MAKCAMMSLLDWKCLSLAIVASWIFNNIQCGPVKFINDAATALSRDVSKAINYLHRSLPNQMPIEQRCKRYAILLYMAKSKRIPDPLALSRLAGLQDDAVESLYAEINTADLASRLITAIDIYRTTCLDPAFIELIECLRSFDMPRVKAYLDDKELIMIEDLYKRALGPPATSINLNSVDLRGFHPAFRTALKNLFERHFETVRQVSLERALASSQSHTPQSLAGQSIEDTERQSKKMKKRAKQQRYRQRHLERLRERDRISRKRRRNYFRLQIDLAEQMSDLQQYPKELLAQREALRQVKRESQKRYRERLKQRAEAQGSERNVRRQRIERLGQEVYLICFRNQVIQRLMSSKHSLQQFRHRKIRVYLIGMCYTEA